MIPHEVFMSRCLDLAARGMGSVSPNPMVGAVLVHEDRIIAEGYHQQYGQAHAEVRCLASVHPHDIPLIKSATLYVSLEPCSHHGRTPPCADLIIDRGIPHVVVGSHDPNPLVSGRGIAKMKEAGITVTEHVLEKECDYLNRRFMTFHISRRPYIILKWAQSADGFFAPQGGKQLWLTNQYSKKLLHKWRTEEDAILVGAKTAMTDDPQLTARLWHGSNPVRILIDMGLKVPADNKIFDDEAMTIIYNQVKEGLEQGVVFIKVKGDRPVTEQIVADLYHRSIQSVIIEGGAYTLGQFISAGLWDEARIFTAPVRLTEGIVAPQIDGVLISQQRIMDDILTIKMNRSQ